MKIRERITLILLIIALALFCPVRYHPGQLSLTIVETLNEVLPLASIVTGATICIVYFVQKVIGERLPWDRILRIFLGIGVSLELFYALYHFLSQVHG
ncbi:MAG: hypothetical protein KAR13_20570 [Desulfobulbaceae bacterium]|nr:hypothetical protein [Desulfobulbaceae bacterium]MCK5436689.1 hypothetical protein [Desulfobulbaceae bacterium]MCK5543875.1 hypothetical protein [Desulfobulbaceae bacterium]